MKTETFSEAARKNIKNILKIIRQLLNDRILSNIFEVMGKMLTGLWLSFSFLVPFLRVGATLVNLKDVDNFDEFTASLYNRKYTKRKNLHFLQEFLLICLYFV